MAKGISPLLATTIILAVVLAVAVAYALWFKGIVGAVGYGTRPVRLGVADFRVLGPLAIFRVHNIGSDTVYIDDITINNRRVELLTAYEIASKNLRVVFESGHPVVVSNPGELIEVWVILSEGEFQPGNAYRVSLHTTLGFEIFKVLKAFRAAMVEPKVEIYIRNRGVTYCIDLLRMKWKVYNGDPQSPGNVLWEGKLRFVEGPEVVVNSEFKQQPVVAVRNPKAGKGEDYIIWMNHNNVGYEHGSGYYKLDAVQHSVPMLDYIFFCEDLWNGPGNAGDADYNEHVTRVTWRIDGSVRIAVYFGAHGYTLDVYVGGEYVYTIQGEYRNITDFNYNGFRGTDDLRCAISGKIFELKP